MKMTMYYVRAIGEKKDMHLNVPGTTVQAVYDALIGEFGRKITVAEVTPLFDFVYEEEKKIVGVN
jgi:hypothetical protein